MQVGLFDILVPAFILIRLKTVQKLSWAVKIFMTSLWCGSECLGISSELKNHLPVSVVCRLLSGHHYEVTESSWEDSYPVHSGYHWENLTQV